MSKTTAGIVGLCVSLSSGVYASDKNLTMHDIPDICQQRIRDRAYFTENLGEYRKDVYGIAHSSSSSVEEGTLTSRYEVRIWRNPRPVFADSVRMECRWTEGGNIYFSYEEPSPINRSGDYYGQDSYLAEYSTYSPDEKTLLEAEVVRRDFGQPYLFNLIEELREGMHHVENPNHVRYVVGKVASEITDTNPETGTLMVDFAKRNPSKGKIKFYVASKHLKTENGIDYRVLERFQYDKTHEATAYDPENFHMIYGFDTRRNIVHIEKDIYDFNESSENIFHLEKTASIVQDFTYTTGIKFEGHNVFDESMTVRSDPETGACLSQIHVDYHYELNGSDKPVYWRDITKIPCPSKKKKRKEEEPETITTKRERVTLQNLSSLSATRQVYEALIFPGELTASF